MKPFFLYMLRCADGSYYVGHTDDLEVRIAQHQDGSGGGHTSSRRPVELVYSCEFETRDEAFEREMQVKGWSRAKKEALIREEWTALPELSRPRTGPGSELPLVLRQAQHERDTLPVNTRAPANDTRAPAGDTREPAHDTRSQAHDTRASADDMPRSARDER